MEPSERQLPSQPSRARRALRQLRRDIWHLLWIAALTALLVGYVAQTQEQMQSRHLPQVPRQVPRAGLFHDLSPRFWVVQRPGGHASGHPVDRATYLRARRWSDDTLPTEQEFVRAARRHPGRDIDEVRREIGGVGAWQLAGFVRTPNWTRIWAITYVACVALLAAGRGVYSRVRHR